MCHHQNRRRVDIAGHFAPDCRPSPYVRLTTNVALGGMGRQHMVPPPRGEHLNQEGMGILLALEEGSPGVGLTTVIHIKALPRFHICTGHHVRCVIQERGVLSNRRGRGFGHDEGRGAPGGATTTGPDATPPPAICQNLRGGGVGGGSSRGSGGGGQAGSRGGGVGPGSGGCPARGEGGGIWVVVRVRVRVSPRVRVNPRVRVRVRARVAVRACSPPVALLQVKIFFLLF